MGLGTKIKEALGGDRGSQRRKAPGAFPEHTDNIPRSNTATTFQTAQTNSQGPQAQDKPDRAADDEDYDEYTATPTGITVSPLSGDAKVDNGFDWNERKSPVPQHQKEYRNLQHPYWGDVGKPDSNDFAAAQDNNLKFSDKDSGIGKNSDEYVNTYEAKNGMEIDGKDQSRNNRHTISQGADGLTREHFDQLDAPTGNVSRGRAVLVDDEAAMISSMAASQHSHGSQLTETPGNYQAPSWRHGDNNGYHPGYNAGGASANAMDYEDYNAPQNHAAVNNRYDGNNVYATRVSPTQQHSDRPFSPEKQVPAQGLSKTGTGFSSASNPRSAVGTFGNSASPVAYNDNVPSNQAYGGQAYPGQAVANLGNNPGTSMSPTKVAGGDHYGPGHGGARVLHQCVHCGNDNDITKYFSKDVVYRLS